VREAVRIALFFYLKCCRWSIERYVRNITDVGHLEHDADEGEDKIAKKARLEELERKSTSNVMAGRACPK